MQQKIEDLVSGVMAVIETKNYPQNSLNIYRYSYNSIIKWFNENNGGFYDLETSAKYLSERQELLLQKKIQPSYYQHSKRYLNFLQEYAETGDALLTYECGKRIYQPSHESITMTESVLSASPLPDKSKSKYRTLLNKFFCFTEGQELTFNDITFKIMLDFLNHVHAGGVSNTSIYHTFRMLKILAEHLTLIGIMKAKPDFSCFTPKSHRKKIISAFSMDEVSKILGSFDKTTPIGKRNYAIVLFACGTGLRASDIANIRLRDINWKSGEVSILQEKTQKPLKVILSGQIRNAISSYIIDGRPNADTDVIFLSVRAPYTSLNSAGFSGIIERACVDANIQKKSRRSFHSLRRSFGTWMAKEEVSVHTISQMLGQKVMDSSVPYISFDDKQILSCALGFDNVPLNGGVYK